MLSLVANQINVCLFVLLVVAARISQGDAARQRARQKRPAFLVQPCGQASQVRATNLANKLSDITNSLEVARLQLNITLSQFEGIKETYYQHIAEGGFEKEHYPNCFPSNEKSWFQKEEEKTRNKKKLMKNSLKHFLDSLKTFGVAIYTIKKDMEEREDHRVRVFDTTSTYFNLLFCEVQTAYRKKHAKKPKDCLREDLRSHSLTWRDLMDYEVVIKYETLLRDWIDIFGRLSQNNRRRHAKRKSR